MDQLTLAALFSAAGAIAAAAVVRQFVELVKFALPAIGERVSGALQAFVASAVLYAVAYVAVGPFTPEGGFAAFLAWLACAVGAVGIDATLGHVTGSDQAKVDARVTAAYKGGFGDGTEVLAMRQSDAGMAGETAPGGTV